LTPQQLWASVQAGNTTAAGGRWLNSILMEKVFPRIVARPGCCCWWRLKKRNAGAIKRLQELDQDRLSGGN